MRQLQWLDNAKWLSFVGIGWGNNIQYDNLGCWEFNVSLRNWHWRFRWFSCIHGWLNVENERKMKQINTTNYCLRQFNSIWGWPELSILKMKDWVGSADSKAAHIWGKNLTAHNYNKLVLVAVFERLKMFRGDRILSRRGSECVDKRRNVRFCCKCNIRVLLSGSNKMLLCWISRYLGK